MPNCDWLHFAERCGREGRGWAEQYRSHAAKLALGGSALQRMREGRVEQGGELLREFICQVEGVCGEPASVRAVLDRYRHGIEGYYFYCRGEFDAAERSMRAAHDAVARALGEAGWLLLLAVHCQEFCMHRARIARNRRRWSEMQSCISQARAMMSDRLPLCETEDGRKIWWSGFEPFFAAQAPLSDEEARVADTLLNPQERERLFDQFVREMLRSSGNGGRYPLT
jgi:hypothetical protein